MKNQNDNTKIFKMLVVEDAPPNQMLLLLLLQKMGHQVTTANNGKEAVKLASNNNFDLILMDMQMPVMDGFQATRELRSKGNKTKIIAITGNVLQKDIDKSYRAGCNDYLTKPIDKAALKRMLDKHLSTDRSQFTEKINTLKQQTEQLIELCDSDKNSSDKQISIKPANLVDIDDAIRFCGDEKAIKRTAKSILTDGKQCMKMIQSAIDKKNTSELLLASHRLRGICLLIGAKQTALAAERIEDQASTGYIGNSPDLLLKLTPLFEALTVFLTKPDWFEIASSHVKAMH